MIAILRKRTFWFLIAVTLLAFILRAWQSGIYPPGLFPDETSIGYEGFAILHYGVDRNGVSYPAFLISWGGGQNVLYAYLAAPFIAILGLSTFAVRLPMLLVGTLCIPLLWQTARVTFGQRAASMAALFLCISPWHIMMSRWALESNLLVFTFLLGCLCVVYSIRNPRWFLPALISFGLCLYAYGTAYLAVPIFLVGSAVILNRQLVASLRVILVGLVLSTLLVLPIATVVLINYLKLGATQIGPIGIPRMPATPRYEMISILFQPASWPQLAGIISQFARIMWMQDDGLIWNALPGIGFAYGPVTLILACIGLVLGTIRHRTNAVKLLLLWTAIGILIGIVQEPNINRINILMMPFILWVAVAVDIIACTKWLRGAVMLLALAVCVVFLYAYFISYRDQITEQFFAGLEPALERAVQNPDAHVCVTDQANMPYIYTLFADRTDPRIFVRTVEYANPRSSFRQVLRFSRFVFGVQNCDSSMDMYVLRGREKLPPGTQVTDIGHYYDFVVYRKGQVYASLGVLRNNQAFPRLP